MEQDCDENKLTLGEINYKQTPIPVDISLVV